MPVANAPAKAGKEQPPPQKPEKQKPATEKEIWDLLYSFKIADQKTVQKYVPLVNKLSLPANELRLPIQDYKDKFGDPYDYVTFALPALLGKTTSIEQLKEWDKELKPLIQDYKNSFGNPSDYVNFALLKLLEKATSAGQLKEWDKELKPLIQDYMDKFGNPTNYVGSALPKLLEKSTSTKQLKEWDNELKLLIQDYKDKFGDPSYYVVVVLPKLLEKVTSFEQLKELRPLIQDYQNKFGDPYLYVKDVLPNLLEKTTSIEQLKELKLLIQDYQSKFGNPYYYVRNTLPELLEKATSIKQLKEWDKELKPLIQDYMDKFGNPTNYVGSALPKLLEKTTSIEQLKEWDKELKLLIQDYQSKFGDSYGYVASALPKLLEKTTSIEQLKEWDKELKLLIQDYMDKFGNPDRYVASALPALLEKTTSAEQLKELRLLIQDYQNKFGDPYLYVKDVLPNLLEKATSFEQLLKTQLALFNAGIGDVELIPWFAEMLEKGKLGEGELRLTRLHLTSAVLQGVSLAPDFRNLDTGEITQKALLTLLREHAKVRAELNLVEDFLISGLKLEGKQAEKLARAFSSERTDVRRSLLSRGLFHTYKNKEGMPALQLLLKHEAEKSLPEAMEFFPSLVQMQKDKVLSRDEATSILASGNAAGKAGILLSAKVEETFGLKVKRMEGKEALKDPNFTLDLLTFNSNYKQVPKAREILKALAKAYFEEGTEGVKKYKFSHDLAGKQAPVELHAKLKGLDGLAAKSGAAGAKPFDAFATTLKDYQDHRRQQGFAVEKIVDANAMEGQLTQLKAEAASPQFKAALERRDGEALKRMELSGGDAKARGKAIGLLKALKGVEAMRKGEELVEAIGKIGSLAEAEQAAALLKLKAERQAEIKEIASILQVVQNDLQKKGKPEPSQVVAEMHSLLTELARYEERRGTAAEVWARVGFNLKHLLKIGRHGASGQGNCQRSTYAASLSQSLMSFIGDAHEFQILFRSGREIIGFMQLHGALTEEGRFIFLLELNKPYTNRNELVPSIKDSAERLARKISEKLGIPVYDPYSTGEKVSIKIPASYVSRYLDFLAASKAPNEFGWSGNARRL